MAIWGDWRKNCDYELAAAAHVLGWLDAEEANWVAVAALSAGIDSLEIRLAAGLTKAEANESFDLVCTAFGQIIGFEMDRNTALGVMIRHQWVRIATGLKWDFCRSMQTVHQLWWDVENELAKDERLAAGWDALCHLWYWLDDATEYVSKDESFAERRKRVRQIREVRQTALEQAKQFLSNNVWGLTPGLCAGSFR